MGKRSKEWREKISRSIAQKWKDEKYREKQMSTRQSEEYRGERSKEMHDKWQKDDFKDRMTGEQHPNWNPNREEVQKPYGPGWYGEKEEHIKSLREEQGNRDALTGDKFKENDIIVRHHIDHDKSNNDLNNLAGLTPETHARVHNESEMTKDEYIKAFQDGKENLKRGIPPDHWSEKNREDYRKEKNQETNPVSDNNSEKIESNQKKDNNSDNNTKEKSEENNEKNSEVNNEPIKDSKQPEKNSDQPLKDSQNKKDEDQDPSSKNESKESTEGLNQGETPKESEKDNVESMNESTHEPTENQPNESPEEVNKEPKSETSGLPPGKRSDQEIIEERVKAHEEYLDRMNDLQKTIIGGVDYRDSNTIVATDSNGRDWGRVKPNINTDEKDYAGIDEDSGESGKDFDGIEEHPGEESEDYEGIDEEYGGSEYGGEA